MPDPVTPAHPPRFTARVPDTRQAVALQRLDRCTTVAACDQELRQLAGRLKRASLPETIERLRADIDAVLDRRTVLALDQALQQPEQEGRP